MHALLVIDVQVAIIAGAYRENETLAAIAHSIRLMRDKQIPVIFIQHCHDSFTPMMKGEPGWQLHPSMGVSGTDIILEKQASDAFYQTELQQTLIDLNVNNLFVCGLQTEFCIDTTCRSAMSHGFNVTLISDGHTTGDAALSAKDTIRQHHYALKNLAHPNCHIRLCESHKLSEQMPNNRVEV